MWLKRVYPDDTYDCILRPKEDTLASIADKRHPELQKPTVIEIFPFFIRKNWKWLKLNFWLLVDKWGKLASLIVAIYVIASTLYKLKQSKKEPTHNGREYYQEK